MSIGTMSMISRFSPFSSSLFAPSPHNLPAVPSLAELQKHVQAVKDGVWEVVPTFTKTTDPYSDPNSNSNPVSKSTPGGLKSKTNNSSAISIASIKSWGSPPRYTPNDPIKEVEPNTNTNPGLNSFKSKNDDDGAGVGSGVGRNTLKKNKIGWMRIHLQKGIPGEEEDTRVPRMNPSKAYAEETRERYTRIEETQRQIGIDEMVVGYDDRQYKGCRQGQVTWWKW